LIPINNNENYYLIVNMDFDQYDFDKIITEKIIPLIKQDKDQISNSRVDHYEFRLYPSSGY
jgi:hypothetical protein